MICIPNDYAKWQLRSNKLFKPSVNRLCVADIVEYKNFIVMWLGVKCVLCHHHSLVRVGGDYLCLENIFDNMFANMSAR